MTALLLLAPGLPLLLAAAQLWPRLGARLLPLAPWAPLPALLLAAAGSGHSANLPWLGLGLRLAVDPLGQVFLLFTALLWWLCGLYAHRYLEGDAHHRRFSGFFLASMAGNLGLILAQDLFGFLAFYALMSFAAFGLVIHRNDPEAHRAGRVYLVLVLVGEVLLFSGLLLYSGGEETLSLQTALLVLGFGIKAGALPLHVWLPLAHPVAPTPASAVLSGAMIKAGLIGWLRFLPLGEIALPAGGSTMIVLGVLAALAGVLAGLTQREPKVLLAYSSISQMGLMTTAVGVVLAVPETGATALPVIGFYALHHGLAKGALFLGVGLGERVETAAARNRVLAGMAVCALVMAGLPLTSGALAKTGLKGVWANWPEGGAALVALLPLTTLGTTALMLRLLWLLRQQQRHSTPHPAPWRPWVGLVTGVILSGEVGRRLLEVELATVLAGALWWPLLAGAALALPFFATRLPDRLRVPPGDLLKAYGWLLGGIVTGWNALAAWAVKLSARIRWRCHGYLDAANRAGTHLERLETALGSWLSGSGWLVTVILLLMLFSIGA